MKRFGLNLIFATAVLGALIGAVTELLMVAGLPILSPKRSALLLVIALVSGGLLYFRRLAGPRDAATTEQGAGLIAAFSAAAVIWATALIFSDFLDRRFVFYLGTEVRREFLAISLCAAVLIAIFSPVFTSAGRGLRLPPAEPLFLLFQILAAVSFIQCANGRLIFSDDHPSFLYRFQELVRHFPTIPYYNIDWNGGYVAREFFATGAIGSYLLFFPFISLAGDISTLDGARIYSLIVPYLFVFLVPWSVYLAARLFGLSRTVASIAGILALGPSLGYFEWVLKYGTLGFALSAGLLPLVTALALRLGFGPAMPRWSEVFAFVVLTYLFLCWPLAVVTLVPIIPVWLYSLWRGKKEAGFYPSRERWIKIAVFSILTALLQLPTTLVLTREAEIADIAASNALPGSTARNVETIKPPEGEREDGSSAGHEGTRRFIQRFQENMVKVNPLILLFLIPGGIALGRGMQRRLILAVGLGALALHLIGPYYKPQFELRRMIYPALFIGSLAAAAGIAAAFEVFLAAAGRQLAGRASGLALKASAGAGAAALCGLFFISPITISSIYLNRSIEKFVFAPPLVEELSSAITANGGSGRTFFFGFMLHDLANSGGQAQDGGHIAPLANFTGRPLYAFYFTHSKWSIVDPVPQSYRDRGAAGIEEFLDLVNATSVVTHQKEWADYCKADPRYVEVFHRDRFRMFVRNRGTGSYFLSGAGEVEPAHEGFKVKLQSNEAVLKYRYFPRLRAAPAAGVEIFPVPAFEEESGTGKKLQVNYVGIRLTGAKPGETITIGFYPG